MCVCVFYTQVVFQTLGFISIFWLLLLAATLALPAPASARTQGCCPPHPLFPVPHPQIHFQERQLPLFWALLASA